MAFSLNSGVQSLLPTFDSWGEVKKGFMTLSLRRLFLTAHVVFSVSWIGAAGSFLTLNAVALTIRNHEVVRGAYLSMNFIGIYVIVPLSLGALATGLILSLGTHWGLLRRYWVVAKLLLTILAVYALFMHQFTAVNEAAKLAAVNSVSVLTDDRLRSVGIELFGDVTGGLLVLLVVAMLAFYKPWGLTLYGRDKERTQTFAFDNNAVPPLGFSILLITTAALVIIFKVTLHLTVHSMHHGQ